MVASRAPAADAILMILDKRDDAEEIATELRGRGQDVDVREVKNRDVTRLTTASADRFQEELMSDGTIDSSASAVGEDAGA